MTTALLECVPNMAEGRDRRVIHAVMLAMRLPGVVLLDASIDPDANRSIITIAGPPEAVCEAAIRATGVASERIDLTRAPAGHPRLGAMDVLPFVPLEGIDLLQCAVLARETAASLWDRYSVPSYFYEAAAARPDRVLLDDVRRGQFEGLRELVWREPGRRPDVGGPGLHPTAGATAVGARRVLIEYRVLLGTPDLGAARAVARSVRESGSGLAGVKATALLVGDAAQVTFLIADHRQAGIAEVYSAVVEAARRHRIAEFATEVVGLLPESAFDPASEWVQHLRTSRPEEQILEHRLATPPPWPVSL